MTNDHVPDPGGADAPSFSKALQLPATSRQVAQFIASRAAACVGADYSNVALLGPGGESLRVYHDSVLEAEIADRYSDIPLGALYPLTQAAMGRVVLLADLDAYREQFPELLADTIAAGFQATASLPLNRADGSLIGAIGFAWSEPTRFDLKLESALRAVAYLCTETLERAERYDAEHALIVELQARLLGDIPTLAGIQTGARYLPASTAPSVGGDWYDGLLVSDSKKMAVVVGDVTGHGVAAAADMALIRGMMSALLHAGVPVSDVFREVSGVLGQRKGVLLATAALAVVDVAADLITFATAGHPPPLLLLPGGEVRALSTANSPIMGVATTRTVSDTAPFPRGAQLVMYTDGLVERRDRGFDVGIAEAAHHLATLSDRLNSQDLIDSLLDKLVGGARPEDDIAIIVIEHV